MDTALVSPIFLPSYCLLLAFLFRAFFLSFLPSFLLSFLLSFILSFLHFFIFSSCLILRFIACSLDLFSIINSFFCSLLCSSSHLPTLTPSDQGRKFLLTYPDFAFRISDFYANLSLAAHTVGRYFLSLRHLRRTYIGFHTTGVIFVLAFFN